MTWSTTPGEMVPTLLDDAGVFVILPVINEIEHIEALLGGIHQQLARHPYTVLVIDDGSMDGTVEKVQALREPYGNHLHLLQRRKVLRGSQRGSALCAGVVWGLTHTNHLVFVEMDGDLSHRPVELKTGIHLIRDEGYDVSIASKFMPGGQVINRPLGRHLLSWVSSLIVRFLLNWRIKDYSNGYRFYSRTAADLLVRHEIKYGSPIYLTEVMAIWLKNCMRIVEFPSIYIGRNEGLSKLRYVDLAKALVAVFEIGFRYHITGFCNKGLSLKETARMDSTSPNISRDTDAHKRRAA